MTEEHTQESTPPAAAPKRKRRPRNNARAQFQHARLHKLELAFSEREVAMALLSHQFNRTKAAEYLGVARRTIQHRMVSRGLTTSAAIVRAAVETGEQLRARALGMVPYAVGTEAAS